VVDSQTLRRLQAFGGEPVVPARPAAALGCGLALVTLEEALSLQGPEGRIGAALVELDLPERTLLDPLDELETVAVGRDESEQKGIFGSNGIAHGR
jgi:hypothetical protein